MNRPVPLPTPQTSSSCDDTLFGFKKKYVYIGGAIVALVVGYLVWKRYSSKGKATPSTTLGESDSKGVDGKAHPVFSPEESDVIDKLKDELLQMKSAYAKEAGRVAELEKSLGERTQMVEDYKTNYSNLTKKFNQSHKTYRESMRQKQMEYDKLQQQMNDAPTRLSAIIEEVEDNDKDSSGKDKEHSDPIQPE